MESTTKGGDTKPRRHNPIINISGSVLTEFLTNGKEPNLAACTKGTAKPKQARLRGESGKPRCTAATTDRKKTGSGRVKPEIDKKLPTCTKPRSDVNEPTEANWRIEAAKPRQVRLCTDKARSKEVRSRIRRVDPNRVAEKRSKKEPKRVQL